MSDRCTLSDVNFEKLMTIKHNSSVELEDKDDSESKE